MHVLLGVFGRGTTIDTAELLIQWLKQYGPGFVDAGPAEARVAEIIDALSHQQFRRAEQLLRLHLFACPGDVHGLLAAAALDLGADRHREAQELLTDVFHRQPGNTIALYCLGVCHELLRQGDQAVEFYQDCLKFKDSLELPLWRLAALYCQRGHYDQAAAMYQSLHRLSPDDMPTQVVLGHLQIAAGHLSQAVETFSKAILTHPDSFGIQDPQVDQLLVDGDYQEALNRIEELLEQSPTQPELLAKRADILSLLTDPTEAIAAYQEALQECPNLLDAVIKLGTQYLRTESYQLAAEQFNRAQSLISEIIDAYIGLAVAHAAAHEKTEALAALGSAAMIYPNSVLLFTETAKTLLKYLCPDPLDEWQDRPEAAIAELHRCYHARLHATGPQVQPLYELSLLEMYHRGPQAALDLLDQAADAQPTTWAVLTRQVICLYNLGQAERAYERLGALAQPDPSSLGLHYERSLLAMRPTKLAGAILNLEQRFARAGLADPAPAVRTLLRNIGILDAGQSTWESLYTTLTGTISPTDRS